MLPAGERTDWAEADGCLTGHAHWLDRTPTGHRLDR